MSKTVIVGGSVKWFVEQEAAGGATVRQRLVGRGKRNWRRDAAIPRARSLARPKVRSSSLASCTAATRSLRLAGYWAA